MAEKYRLRIDVWTPETLPAGRLGAYLVELSRLLGEPNALHFHEVEAGSALIAIEVDTPYAPRVRTRMDAVRTQRAPQDALRAIRAIDTLLAEDNAVGDLEGPDKVVYVHFPGRDRPKPVQYGPVWEDGSLVGTVVKVGGIDSTIPIWIQDGERVLYCTANVDLSRELAQHYRGAPVRVHGRGKWIRNTQRVWELKDFRIDRFDVLEDVTLQESLERLRAAHAPDPTTGDPMALMSDLRGESGPH